MLELDKYFKSNLDVNLYHIEFNIIENNTQVDRVELECIDDLVIKGKDNVKANFIFTRNIKFNPSCLYELSVSFIFSLIYDQDAITDIDLDKIDLVNELKENKNIYLGNVISRASLHIAQITSSSGLMPIITPPSFCG